MSHVDDVGEVSVDGGTTLRWTLPRYTQTPHGEDTVLWSPYFTFRGEEKCYLGVYPNGLKCANSEEWTGIECNLPSLPPASTVTCCVVGREGREILHTEAEGDYKWYTQDKWIRRSELEARSEELLPGGTLRVVVRVVLTEERRHRAEEASGAEKVGTKMSDSSNSDNCRHNHKGVSNLSRSLKDLYIDGKDSDFIVSVRGREFRAHRLLLKTRIPAFDAMLTHNMAENKEGVVKVEDCDPDVFHQFLLFVYSGCVENISWDNLYGLYVLADKYGLQDLKDICLDSMKTSLSAEMICDVISLAIRHGEAELLELATDFFVKNAEEILVTVKWQEFLVENPTEGNDLFLKTLKHGYTKAAKK